MSVTVWTPDRRRQLAEDCADDWPRLMFDGFGIMVSPEQEEARQRLGQPGPRHPELGEHKVNWLSGGQRAGKTVFAFGPTPTPGSTSAASTTEPTFWTNYQYGTLAIAPTDALTLRLWQIGDEISKGAHDAQYDTKARRSRGGAFIGKLKAGKRPQGQRMWTLVERVAVEFRSSEGWAYRLEGGQWWWITWDEWASQPDREIRKILTDVLFGRARDHDAKIMPMAWPKEETEHHLIAVIREIEAGRDRDSQVIYLAPQGAVDQQGSARSRAPRPRTRPRSSGRSRASPPAARSREFKQPG
jgi:hypothetical protein